MTTEEQLKLYQQFYEIIVSCDAQNDLMVDLFAEYQNDHANSQPELNTWAELKAVCAELDKIHVWSSDKLQAPATAPGGDEE